MSGFDVIWVSKSLCSRNWAASARLGDGDGFLLVGVGLLFIGS